MSNAQEEPIILAGDIGGTKTNLGLFSGTKENLKLLSFRTYQSNSAPSLAGLLDKFCMDENCDNVATVSFGVAGPVIDGKAKATNLPWRISETDLKARFNFKHVSLINDLVALACAVPYLKHDQVTALNEKAQAKPGNIGLLAAGTGLGEALLIWNGDSYTPCPSEGGHKNFAPRTEKEWRLHQYLAGKYGHVSIERILSGHGLVDIYSFLREYTETDEPGWLAKRFAGADAGAVISQTALAGEDPVCKEALSMFVSLYGAEAGDLALQAMTVGGIYIGGGIGPKIADALKEGPFMESFTAKGRMRELLLSFPVFLITDSRAALWGAAVCAESHQH